jgi:site-specific recombinase XerC
VNLSGRVVRVLGKGRKERIVPFNPTAAAAIRAWLADRDGCARSPRCRRRRGCRNGGTAPTPRGGRRGERAAVPQLPGRTAVHAVRGQDRTAVRGRVQHALRHQPALRCATPSRPICWRPAPTCAPSRSSWATRS